MDVSTLIDPKTPGCHAGHALDLLKPRRVHLVGVAGNGMRALANVLAECGWRVSGSDCTLDGALRLAEAGVRLFQGHVAGQLAPDTEVLVYSDAVPPENPELRRAADLGIPVVSYFQMLGRLTAGHHTLAVAGTHGKSTTTAMAAHILIEAGRDPTVFCGATPLGAISGGRSGRVGQSGTGPFFGGDGQGTGPFFGGKACLANKAQPENMDLSPSAPRETPQGGQSHFRGDEVDSYGKSFSAAKIGTVPDNEYIVEACEYRANFLHLRPQHAAILGIEPDHFDCYDSLDEIECAFRRFASSIPAEGLLVVRHDCASTRRATAGLTCRLESFGLCPEADWSARSIAEISGRF